MRRVDAREVIRGVRDRHTKQYAHYSDDRLVGIGDRRKPVGETRRLLAALDLETCSQSDVGDVLNESWLLTCDECGEVRDEVVRFGDEPDYEARYQDLCAACLSKGLALVSPTPSTGA